MKNNLTPHYQQSSNSLSVAEPGSRLALSVEAFLRSLPGKNRSPGTINAYRIDLAFFAVWLIENNVTAVQPATVTRADIEAYLSELARQGLPGVMHEGVGDCSGLLAPDDSTQELNVQLVVEARAICHDRHSGTGAGLNEAT